MSKKMLLKDLEKTLASRREALAVKFEEAAAKVAKRGGPGADYALDGTLRGPLFNAWVAYQGDHNLPASVAAASPREYEKIVPLSLLLAAEMIRTGDFL